MTQREMERYESVLFLGVVLFSIFFFRFLALAMGISRSVLPSARIIKGETSQRQKKKGKIRQRALFFLVFGFMIFLMMFGTRYGYFEICLA